MLLKINLTILLLITTLFAKDSNMSIYDFKVKTIENKEISLEKYKNKVLLIVNVASKCGFTPQYEGLEKLHDEYKEKGLVILGFPSNQFGSQEPGNNEEIKQFCSLTYDVSFDMFSKVDVNGDKEIPLYTYIKKEASGIFGSESIKWNFTKFLVDKNGKVIDRFAPTTKPQDIEADIKKLL